MMKKEAEILVECGYALHVGELEGVLCVVTLEKHTVPVEPYADTLEGRRQLDAIEDWLIKDEYALWVMSNTKAESLIEHQSQWRLDRIKWCIKQLGER